jgi:4-hydroxy-3-polyprenylbenzoate decarboxylase
MYAPMASGSFQHDGMFVVPCSMKSLSAMAHGYAQTLFERAADVTLKEGRRLVISPRETPFSAIHLENMLKLARLGVKIVPPVIGFYHEPDKMEHIIDFISGKILDAMGFEHNLYKRWPSQRRST